MFTFAGANRKEQRRNGEKQSIGGSPEHFRRLRHLGTDGTTGQGCYDTRTGWHHDGVVSCDGRCYPILADDACDDAPETSSWGGDTARTRSRQTDICWRCSVWTGVQPMLLHHRTQHHLARECEHRDDIDADFCNDPIVSHLEGTHHLEEGGWSGRGLCWCINAGADQCQRCRREGRRRAWRCVGDVCSAILRIVPVAVQSVHQEI